MTPRHVGHSEKIVQRCHEHDGGPAEMAHLKALQRAIPPPVVDCNTNGGCKLDRDASLLQIGELQIQYLLLL